MLDDMLECKINIINLQDLVNGIDWIAEKLAGRYCIELDIDRQFVTAGGTPKQVDDLIREEVSKIGRKEGGLMMIYGLYPGIPLENIKALMDAWKIRVLLQLKSLPALRAGGPILRAVRRYLKNTKKSALPASRAGTLF